MARILALTSRLPYPPREGHQLRAWHVLRALASRHEVTLLSFQRRDDLPDEAAPLREAMHRCHVLEADTSWLSVEENYLLGMVVLCATRSYGPAAMFAKTLRHRGTPREKIVEATARLTMWIGPIAAAEASALIQRALRDYDERGMGSLEAWFPPRPADPR